MQTTNDIRATFLNYFATHGHDIVSSSPLVPRNDPSLMFTNAGMVQFKNVFTGLEKRPSKRATSSQKCVRAGGKHNDLDNVGYTARHHTFFEMLGNFSFGDYFKEQAIELAWTLITKEYGLAKDRLLVTVYHSDDDAYQFWKKIAGLPDHRIIRITTHDNFWAMGDTGPCGPCSEIFYDHGDSIPGGPPGSPDQDGDRFIEIWNLVFMQYEQLSPDKRIDLPKPSIDTGMGLERLSAVLQGKHDNYDVDILRTLIESSAEFLHNDPDGPHKISHRVIADHLRSSAFLIADGVMPSNEGRGYVLRRIMRRAMRHAELMGSSEPHLWRLVPTLVHEMGQAFPELLRSESMITETLKLEETRFKQTLQRGLKLLDEETSSLSQGAVLSGKIAFKLYDTYGFPLDLTQDALKNRHITVDLADFEKAMKKQKEDARKAWAGSGESVTKQLWYEIKDQRGASEFLGYGTEQAEGIILDLILEGQRVKKVKKGDPVSLIANQSPFYGESGGQQGDTGLITLAGKGQFIVHDCQKYCGDLIVHHGLVTEGIIEQEDIAVFSVDSHRRASLRAHHSATHLLHAVLRTLCGDHITQKGSLVAPDRLRFDVSHPKAFTPDELHCIERMVNDRIKTNVAVATRLMTPEMAVAQGAMALFGEKYGDEVRVVSMGEDDHRFSIELCGGTHVTRTGDIGFFKIINETAVASGIRRIEAMVGSAAESWVLEQSLLIDKLSLSLKSVPGDLPHRLTSLLEEKRRLEKEVYDLRHSLAVGKGQNDTHRKVAGITLAVRKLDSIPAKDLKPMVDTLKQQIGSGIIVLTSQSEGKASLIIGVTDDLTHRYSAVDLVRVGAEALGGKGGGGRPGLAQAGGPNIDGQDRAISAIEAALSS